MIKNSPGSNKPSPPAAYRPQPVPKCLQAKPDSRQQQVPAQTKRPANAPPVYRPQPTPKVLQTKTAQPRKPASQRPASQPAHVVQRQTREIRSHKSSTIQRHVDIPKSTDATHGRVIELVLKSATSGEFRNLIAMCQNNPNTHLHLTTYNAGRNEDGETMIRVRGDNGTDYDLDNPHAVDWAQVSQSSPITITVRLNAAYVSGFSETVQTFLHEIIVHAAKYVPFIQQMREAPDRRLLARLWIGAAQSSNSGAWQHSRLGRNRDRSLTQDIRAAGKAMKDGRLEGALNAEHHSDVRNHQ